MDALASAADCPEVPSPACLARIARNSGLSRFIWGTLKVKHGRVEVQISLFDGTQTGPNARLNYSSNLMDTFDENLLRLANTGLERLLGPIHFPVQVRSREPKGTIVIDDVVTGKLESGMAEIAVNAGDHRFRLILPDGTAIARSFQVRIEAKNQVRLDFMDIPES
jgi:hypothetical protein